MVISRITVTGIEGADFRRGSPVTPEVVRAVQEVVREIESELAASGRGV
jgi:hypothetical protein